MSTIEAICAAMVMCAACGPVETEEIGEVGQPDAGPTAPETTDCVRDELVRWYADADGDGFGDPKHAVLECGQPDGFVANADDCDDSTPTRAPGAPELCDLLDNDCVPGTPDECAESCAAFRASTGAYVMCVRQTVFADAASTCESMNLQLVRIDSAQENQALRMEMSARVGNSIDYWIGAEDASAESQWTWTDGTMFWVGKQNGQPVGGLFEHWASDQPDNTGDEDCAEVRTNTGQWNDAECETLNAFVCE